MHVGDYYGQGMGTDHPAMIREELEVVGRAKHKPVLGSGWQCHHGGIQGGMKVRCWAYPGHLRF